MPLTGCPSLSHPKKGIDMDDYLFIQNEIERLKLEEDNANTESTKQRDAALLLRTNRMKLEKALREQKEADETKP